MKVLLSAYACEPGRGSEPGAGWAWACAAAQGNDVWVLTHTTNRVSIEAALAADPELAGRLHPVYLRNERWARPLRGTGRTRMLYYVIWQLLSCPRAARRLHREIGFDVAHHLTYASDWLPAGVSRLDGVPFVWGPVGGSSTRRTPALWPRLGLTTLASELIRAPILTAVRRLVGRPLAERAAAVIGQNHDVARAFAPIPVIVEPNVAVAEGAQRDRAGEEPHADAPVAVYAGRLLGLKGLGLAIEALTRPGARGWRLHLYGDGPQRGRLQRLAARHGVADRVRFLGTRPRADVLAALARSDAMVFPSIRDSAGWSVAEAMASGCPVVCLDAGGPAALVGAGDGVLVDPGGDVVADLAAGLERVRRLVPRRDRWSADRLPALLADVYRGAVASGPLAGAGPRGRTTTGR
jgi:glycosyltransferase involved in cell wall biosynthesis